MNNLNTLLILFGLIGSVFIVVTFYIIVIMILMALYEWLYERNQNRINWDLYHDFPHYPGSTHAIHLPKHVKTDHDFPLEDFMGL